MQEELLNIRFDYGVKPTEDQHRMMNSSNHPSREFKLQNDGCLDWGCQNACMTLNDALSIGLPFVIESRTGTQRFDIEQFKQRDTAPVNERCNVIVAGSSVVEFVEVAAHTNLCTDELQQHLREGWRILAICVQPDQRRPDYILGKK